LRLKVEQLAALREGVTPVSKERERNLLLMACPALWSCWPMLPLVRRSRGKEELGVLYDALCVSGTTGSAPTVFHGNLFLLPPNVSSS